MAFKRGTVKPTRKGQKPITFKKGALTRQARARGQSVAEACASPSTSLMKKRCTFKRNVLTGRK